MSQARDEAIRDVVRSRQHHQSSDHVAYGHSKVHIQVNIKRVAYRQYRSELYLHKELYGQASGGD
jgi:hypothetical protein